MTQPAPRESGLRRKPACAGYALSLIACPASFTAFPVPLAASEALSATTFAPPLIFSPVFFAASFAASPASSMFSLMLAMRGILSELVTDKTTATCGHVVVGKRSKKCANGGAIRKQTGDRRSACQPAVPRDAIPRRLTDRPATGYRASPDG